MKKMRYLATVATTCGFFLMAPATWADVVGNLELDAGSNSVTVSATTLVWNGTAIVAGGSSAMYGLTDSTLITPGTVVDLTNLPPASLPDSGFMTIPTDGINYTLTVIGPGSSNTNCSAGPCSVFAGNPIILTAASNGTTATLNLSGTVSDGHSSDNWAGFFDQTITFLPGEAGFNGGNPVNNPTPLQVQEYFQANPAATLTEGYDGSATVSVVGTPEPSTIGMMFLGGGLILAGLRRRKSSR